MSDGPKHLSLPELTFKLHGRIARVGNRGQARVDVNSRAVKPWNWMFVFVLSGWGLHCTNRKNNNYAFRLVIEITRMEILLILRCLFAHSKDGRISTRAYSAPVSSQSTLTLNCCFTRSKTSAGGNINPRSYFESWLWLIPNCSANASCVRSNPRTFLSRLPTALK
jgi:hypothetical protein